MTHTHIHTHIWRALLRYDETDSNTTCLHHAWHNSCMMKVHDTTHQMCVWRAFIMHDTTHSYTPIKAPYPQIVNSHIHSHIWRALLRYDVTDSNTTCLHHVSCLTQLFEISGGGSFLREWVMSHMIMHDEGTWHNSSNVCVTCLHHAWHNSCHSSWYGVATVSRIHQFIGHFCRISSLL